MKGWLSLGIKMIKNIEYFYYYSYQVGIPTACPDALLKTVRLIFSTVFENAF